MAASKLLAYSQERKKGRNVSVQGHSLMPVIYFSHKGYTVKITVGRRRDGSWQTRAVAISTDGQIRLPVGKYPSREEAEKDVPRYVEQWLRKM